MTPGQAGGDGTTKLTELEAKDDATCMPWQCAGKAKEWRQIPNAKESQG